jgi:hypothetical protein
VFFPPRIVVLPAKPLTKTVTTKAKMFPHFKTAELVAAIHTLSKLLFKD